jgi:hypothetical protein
LHACTPIQQSGYRSVFYGGKHPYTLDEAEDVPPLAWSGWREVASKVVGINPGRRSVRLVAEYCELLERMSAAQAAGLGGDDDDPDPSRHDRRKAKECLTKLQAAFQV